MRSTKVLAFSVPKELEKQIQQHAQAEHRTISEYIREAVRQYMTLKRFDTTQKAVSKRMKKKGLRPADIEKAIEELRRGKGVKPFHLTHKNDS